MAKTGKRGSFGPAQLKIAIKMRREGAPLRAIAERLGCSKALVSMRLKEAEQAGQKLPSARTGRPRNARSAPAASSAPTAATTAQGGATPPADREHRRPVFDDSPLPTNPAEALFELRQRRLPEVAQLVRDAMLDGNMTLFRDAARFEIELIEKINAATPPPAPDPEEDPANVEARDRVRERIEKMVRAHERSLEQDAAQ